jgi:iron complex transport system permease protein
MKNKLARSIIILGIIFIIVFFIGILKGATVIPIKEILRQDNRTILYLRLLRTLMAIVIGSGLAVSGITFQAILRNSLAEPYILGTSSGAGLGALIALTIGLGHTYIPLAAFAGAMLTIILVYSLAKTHNKISDHSLILSGVMVSLAISAIIVLLISLSGNQRLHDLTWWLWGNLQIFDVKLLMIVSIIVLTGTIVVYLFAQDLNALSIGEEEAIHLGINTQTVKNILLLITSLMTASIVCISGIIGFVGLMVPHLMRLIVGHNHKILIPTACIAAALFMIFCDVLSRTLLAPIEIPIGVITALVGAPVFIILLKQNQRTR